MDNFLPTILILALVGVVLYLAFTAGHIYGIEPGRESLRAVRCARFCATMDQSTYSFDKDICVCKDGRGYRATFKPLKQQENIKK